MNILSRTLCTGGSHSRELLRHLRYNSHLGFPIRQKLCLPVRCSASNSKVPLKDVSEYPAERIRNFSIIAHIDHGKSTLADRLLELTGTIDMEFENKQVLDNLKVERERGITIKAQTVTIFHTHKGDEYMINLIDTPGHADFTYEVSRSLTACQGCVLLVDATQGVQAQTVANFYLAFDAELKIIPVLNKMDMPAADVEGCGRQMHNLTDCGEEGIMQISAKTGLGVDDILPAVIEKVPPPTLSDRAQPLKMLVFDSWFVPHRGVLSLVAIGGGTVTAGDSITSTHFGKNYTVDEIGIMHPNRTPTKCLYAGQVGYLLCNMKSTGEARVGDTLFRNGETVDPYPGFKPIKPVVFCGVYPVDPADIRDLTSAMDKLTLNDASVDIQRDASMALGQGWRMGFLGMLHMEVFSQRLEEEYDANVITTPPSVLYKATFKKKGAKELIITSPDKFPDLERVEQIFEPMVIGTLLFPDEHTGKVMTMCKDRRGVILEQSYIDDTRVMMKYRLPLSEILVDFYDNLKKVSSGYATFEYEEDGWEAAKIVKVEMLINGNPVDAMSFLAHDAKAQPAGKAICELLQKQLPKQWFEVAIQARVRNRIVARETIKALRKDVTAKCYGGDQTRRMKLLSRQKEGKKKMKMVGNVEVPKKVFMEIIKHIR